MPDTFDQVLLFSKTWGAIYLGVFFFAAIIWTYWPSHKEELEDAAYVPLEEGDKPWR